MDDIDIDLWLYYAGDDPPEEDESEFVKCEHCQGIGSYEFRSDYGVEYPAVCYVCGGAGIHPE